MSSDSVDSKIISIPLLRKIFLQKLIDVEVSNSVLTDMGTYTLSFITPPLSDLIKLNSQLERVSFQLELSIEENIYTCNMNQMQRCTISYSKDYTPRVNSISNSVTISGEGIQTISTVLINSFYYHFIYVKEYNIRTGYGDAAFTAEAYTYLYNGQKFKTRLIPSITSVSSHQGLFSGGHNIQIKGKAWKSQNNVGQVKFSINGGSECIDIDNSLKFDPETLQFSIKCQTTEHQIKDHNSGTSAFIGGHGWHQRIYMYQEQISSLVQNQNVKQFLHFNAQSPIHRIDYQSNISYEIKHASKSRSFFKAPKTGYFRFWAKTQSNFKMYLSLNPGEIPNQWNQETDLIIKFLGKHEYGYFSNYDGVNFPNRSEKLYLEKNQYYFIQMLSVYINESQGSTEIALQVQETENKIKTIPQIQRVGFSFIPKIDQYRFKIQWDSSAKFIDVTFNMIFKDANIQRQSIIVNDIKVNTSLDELYQKIRANYSSKFYQFYYLYQVKIIKKFILNDGVTPTNLQENAKYILYSIRLKDYMESEKYKDHQPNFYPQVQYSYQSEIQFLPGELGIGGSFNLKIQDFSGDTQTLSNISHYRDIRELENRILELIPEYIDYLSVEDLQFFKTNDQFQNYAGNAYIISFKGNLPQIISQVGSLKYGNQNKQPTMISQTIFEYSTDQFFTPAPYQFFFTPHLKPQITIQTNQILGACADFNSCDYQLIHIQSLIMSGILTPAAVTPQDQYNLVIEGEKIGEGFNQVSEVGLGINNFGSCLQQQSSMSVGSITCRLVQPTAGKYFPYISTSIGYIPRQKDFTENLQIKPIIISSSKELRRGGREIIELRGKGFPLPGTKNDVEIIIQGKACNQIKYISYSQIQCSTSSFEDIIQQKASLTITINESSLIMPQFFDLLPPLNIKATVTPNKILGSQKQNLTIKIQGVMEKAQEFQILLIENSTLKQIRMRVFDHQFQVIEKINTIIVRYPGADSGTYTLDITNKDIGFVCQTQNQIIVGARVNSISPKEGSLFGGTLLTITGQRFHSTQTRVIIGDGQCKINSVSDQEIKCYTPQSPKNDPNNNEKIQTSSDVVVVINLVELAMPNTENYQFYWKQDLTTSISDISYNVSTNEIKIFPTNLLSQNKEDITVQLSGLDQKVIDASQAQITAELTQIANKDSQKPLQFSMRVKNSGFAKIPKEKINFNVPDILQFTSISPQQEMQQGGQDLIIIGDGFPLDIQGQILSIDEQNTICSQVIYQSKTELKCKTRFQFFNNIQGLKLKNTINNQQAICSSCKFQTKQNSRSVRSLTNLGYAENVQQIKIAGNFLSQAEIQKIQIGGYILADEWTVVSDTQVIAKFSRGIGYGQTCLSSLKFVDGGYAKVQVWICTQTPLSEDYVSQNVVCSYFGGCKWQINAKNINADFQKDQQEYQIKVCNEKCSIQPVTDKDHLTCRIPSLPTVVSYSKYKQSNLIQSKLLREFKEKQNKNVISSSLYNLFDNDLTTTYGFLDSIQIINSITDYLFTLNNIRLYIQNIHYTNLLVGGTFLASEDGGSQWVQLFTIDEVPLQGWNSYDIEQSIQQKLFNRLRFTPSTQQYNYSLSQIQIIGKVLADDSKVGQIMSDGIIKCNIEIYKNQKVVSTYSSMYSIQKTALVTDIQPEYISPQGGQIVTFKFQNTLNVSQDQIFVTISGIACQIEKFLEKQIKCKSGKRLFSSDQQLKIEIGKNGFALIKKGLQVVYTHKWSDPQTWSGQYPPTDGDSIFIPKGQIFIFDIEKSPILKSVTVEGSLLFFPDKNDPNHTREFNSQYIIVRGGLLQAGTEAQPYTSKLIFTMHATQQSKQLPLFGNNVLAVVNNGALELHGKNKTPSWSKIQASLKTGDTSLSLQYNNQNGSFNWDVGDQIIIASTNFNTEQSQKLKILAIDSDSNNNPFIEFTPALKFNHYAGVQELGNGLKLDIRAQVGLLSHSIKFQGNVGSQKTYHGATMIFYSLQSQLSIKLQNLEFFRGGQAKKLNRSPCNFLKFINAQHSYIRNSSIHKSFQSAIILHEVNQLKVSGIVAFSMNAHGFVMSTGKQLYNIIENNLFLNNYKSYFYTSQVTPSLYWIKNPRNYFRENYAVGSLKNGFWFDLSKNFPCSEGYPLLEFEGNVAHSNLGNGLQISTDYIPRTKPCSPHMQNLPSVDDIQNIEPEEYAFGDNAPVPSQFKNFKAFKNKIGIKTQKIGAVSFRNIILADNSEVAFDATQPGQCKLQQGFLDQAVIVGKSKNQFLFLSNYGIRTGVSDSFTYKNINFFNFKGENSAAIIIGLRNYMYYSNTKINTHYFQNVKFSQVNKRIQSQDIVQIFHDIDGSLSQINSQSWVTKFLPHLDIANICETNILLPQYIVCSKPIRRVGLSYSIPSYLRYTNQYPKHYKITLSSKEPVEEEKTTILEYYSQYNLFSQTVFVIGNQYNIAWDSNEEGQLQISRDRQYKKNEEGILLRFNYSTRKDEVNVYRYPGQILIKNITETQKIDYSANSLQIFGTHKEDVTKKTYEILINSNKYDAGLGKQKRIKITVLKCRGPCNDEPQPNPDQSRIRYWSKKQDWGQLDKVPKEGDIVTIKKEWTMIYDIESNNENIVNLQRVIIYGTLIFQNQDEDLKHYTLKTQSIIIDGGKLIIGSQQVPYRHKASIYIIGDSSATSFYTDKNSKKFQQKLIYVSGQLSIYGKYRKIQSKLLEKAPSGSTFIKIDSGLQWKIGQQIVVASSGYDPNRSEKLKIKSYNTETGQIELTEALQFSHFGAPQKQTYSTFQYDLRAEVGCLSQDIVIKGFQSENEKNKWGAYLFVTSTFYSQPAVTLQNVQFNSMGQFIEGKISNSAITVQKSAYYPIKIENSSIHEIYGQPLSIFLSSLLDFSNNVFYKAQQAFYFNLAASRTKFSHNFLIQLNGRFDFCLSQCPDTQISENSFVGTQIINLGNVDCNTEQTPYFNNNVIHSTKFGIRIKDVRNHDCGIFKNVLMHHIEIQAFQALLNLNQFTVEKVILVDNGLGLNLGLANGDTIIGSINFRDSLVIGEHILSRDCTEEFQQLPSKNKIIMYTSLGLRSRNGDSTDVDSTRGKETLIKNVVFKDFPSPNERCNSSGKISIIQTHPSASDLVMLHSFNNLILDNFYHNSFSYLPSPPARWINDQDCGQFNCTGPLNVLIRINSAKVIDENNTQLQQMINKTPFDIVSRNIGISQGIGNCILQEQMNAFTCLGDSSSRGLLQFQSLDKDRRDRYISPILVKIQSQGYMNKLNSFMDHTNTGKQKRFQRFVAVVPTDIDQIIEIEFGSTIPRSMLFELHGTSTTQEFVKIKIKYQRTETVRIKKGKFEVSQNQLFRGKARSLEGNQCGQNRWDGDSNILQFTLQSDIGNCSLKLVTKPSLQMKFRIQQNLDNFFNEDGQSKFLNRLASVLNIPIHRIRIVGISAGSVVIQTQIISKQNQTVPDQNQSTQQNEENIEVTQEISYDVDEIISLNQKLKDMQENKEIIFQDWELLEFSSEVILYEQIQTEQEDVPEIQRNEDEQTNNRVTIIIISVVVGIIVLLIIILVVCKVIRKRKNKVKHLETNPSICQIKQTQGRIINTDSRH